MLATPALSRWSRRSRRTRLRCRRGRPLRSSGSSPLHEHRKSRSADIAFRLRLAHDREADGTDHCHLHHLLVAGTCGAEVHLRLRRKDQVLPRRRVGQVHELRASMRKQEQCKQMDEDSQHMKAKTESSQTTPSAYTGASGESCASHVRGAVAHHEVLQERVLVVEWHAAVDPLREVRRLLQEERVALAQHARVHGDGLGDRKKNGATAG